MNRILKTNFTVRGKRKSGFTLIELLTVMAIIIAMGSITVAAYFAMMRGTGVRSSVGHLRATLLMARQWAVLENKPSCVLFGVDSADTNSMWYVPIGQAGTITEARPGLIADAYGDMSIFTNGSPIFNMSESSVPQGVVLETFPPGTDLGGGLKVSYWAIKVEIDGGFGIGDRYGYPIASTNGLPRGFLFVGEGSSRVPKVVVFGSDGSLLIPGQLGGPGGGYQTSIKMFEIMNPEKKLIVKVEPWGSINVEFPK